MSKYLMIGACNGKPIFKQEYEQTPVWLMFRIGGNNWGFSEFENIRSAFEYYSKQYDVLTIMELPD